MKLVNIENLTLDCGELAKISPYDFEGIAKYFADQIQNLPFVDAVEVVRCKDCEHFEVSTCYLHHRDADENDFCSYGEKIINEYTD